MAASSRKKNIRYTNEMQVVDTQVKGVNCMCSKQVYCSLKFCELAMSALLLQNLLSFYINVKL